jgi:ketosteroid isomerase-like protein
MSNKKLLIAIKAAFSGYEKNNSAPLLDLLSSDFTFEMSDSLPYGGRYVGRDEFVGFWKSVAKEWTYFRYDAHEIIDCGDTIVVPVKTDALSVRGIRMQNEHLFLFKVKEGRPIFARLYADTARGRDVIAGHEPRHYPKPDLGDQTPSTIAKGGATAAEPPAGSDSESPREQ